MRRAVLFPLHLLALASGAKSFRDNPLIGSRPLNRAGLHVARLALTHGLMGLRRLWFAPWPCSAGTVWRTDQLAR